MAATVNWPYSTGSFRNIKINLCQQNILPSIKSQSSNIFQDLIISWDDVHYDFWSNYLKLTTFKESTKNMNTILRASRVLFWSFTFREHWPVCCSGHRTFSAARSTAQTHRHRCLKEQCLSDLATQRSWRWSRGHLLHHWGFQVS